MLRRPRLVAPETLHHIIVFYLLQISAGLFGRTADIHDFHHRTLFYFNKLDENQACNNRRNYYIIIQFFRLISVRVEEI